MITARFPVTWCTACEQDTMHYQDLDTSGQLRPHCLHCDQPFEVPQEAPPSNRRQRVRWLNAQAAAQMGYDIEGVELPEAPAGCGKPNCGQGTCKNTGKPHPFA